MMISGIFSNMVAAMTADNILREIIHHTVDTVSIIVYSIVFVGTSIYALLEYHSYFELTMPNTKEKETK